jgi:hypothetical protein
MKENGSRKNESRQERLFGIAGLGFFPISFILKLKIEEEKSKEADSTSASLLFYTALSVK